VILLHVWESESNLIYKIKENRADYIFRPICLREVFGDFTRSH